MSDFKLYSVNWQDGMLITQKHLREQERYLEHLSQWHAIQGGDNYGLIRKSFSGRSALSLNLSVSGNRLRVTVDNCQALTPDGHYIDIGESNHDIVRGEAEISETIVPVYIGVDSESKKAVGEPDPAEDIPRVPYLKNNYTVHLGAAPNMPEGRYVKVAELILNGSEVTLSPSYYPPCMTIYADDRLSETASEMRNRLENLLSLSTRAYRAISTSGSLKGTSTSLQIAFKDTIGNFVYHLASTLDSFIVGPNAGHPINLTVIFKRLFRVFSTLANLHPGLKDYLNERYFSKELSSEIGRYLSAIEGFIMTDYNHQDIGGQIKAIDDILDTLRGVFAFLAQTKSDALGEQAVATETLTYKGRTYRNLTYSGNRLEQIGELCYLLIDIPEPGPVSDIVSLMSKDLFSDQEWQNMQVRLGLNEARGLGETDPVDVDTVAFGNKVALHPRDMLESASVRQVTLIFRGASAPDKFANLGQMDLILYSV
jgi:hypothetical protein